TIPLSYSDGRDTLFGIIDNVNDSLTCVYTGFTIYLDPTQDPTEAAFMNDGADAINTEHTFPQSLGATDVAKRDLHHLYAARKDVNADRANSPFAEIPDNLTDTWYYLDQETSAVPTSNIDLYSEKKGDLFEPPEAHKGNVARSMMYFYTMYKDQADMANPSYFETQRETLCAWHYLDPVDQKEWDRTWKIAEYQDGKPNPFVLDCTLPERSYCADFGQVCTPVVGVEDITKKQGFIFDKIIPNPVKDGASIFYKTNGPSDVFLEIYNLYGEKIDAVNIGKQAIGEHQYFWEKDKNINSGIVIFRLVFKLNNQIVLASKKAAIIK
ncbi:MAG TPA: hypothetical protein ENJ95_03425, partial [Bacteroidetes bacterium]|nr:hypothetical protein [Bacteroidota bacterium]